jgi:hypothetical protein
VAKGVDIEMVPLDEDHVRAKINWSEQDVGGGKIVVEVTVKNTKARPKADDQLTSDARALAVRLGQIELPQSDLAPALFSWVSVPTVHR